MGKYKQPIVHKGAKGCMNVALYLIREVKKGDVVKAEDILLLNGKTPNTGDIVICGSCGKNISLSASGWCE